MAAAIEFVGRPLRMECTMMAQAWLDIGKRRHHASRLRQNRERLVMLRPQDHHVQGEAPTPLMQYDAEAKIEAGTESSQLAGLGSVRGRADHGLPPCKNMDAWQNILMADDTPHSSGLLRKLDTESERCLHWADVAGGVLPSGWDVVLLHRQNDPFGVGALALLDALALRSKRGLDLFTAHMCAVGNAARQELRLMGVGLRPWLGLAWIPLTRTMSSRRPRRSAAILASALCGTSRQQ